MFEKSLSIQDTLIMLAIIGFGIKIYQLCKEGKFRRVKREEDKKFRRVKIVRDKR